MAKHCTNCDKEVTNDNAKFCPYCGNEFQELMTCSCGMSNLPPNAKFCPKCGESLTKKKEKNVENKDIIPPKPLLTSGSCTHQHGHEAVDLGLSVLWSTHNIGASSVTHNGLTFSWGDPTRKTITSKMSNWFKSPPKDSNICGNHEYDMAKFEWGGCWQLPTCEQCLELINRCSWKVVRYQGMSFYQVISLVNGNYILLPLSIKLWIGDRAFGGTVHYIDTRTPEICSEQYDVDHAYYVRPIISKA